MSFSTLLSITKTILVLGIVIILANITLRYLKTYMTKQTRLIKVIERLAINNNSALGIVEICGKYYLMSFTNNDNKILKELDGEEVEGIIGQMENGEVKYFLGMRKEVD